MKFTARTARKHDVRVMAVQPCTSCSPTAYRLSNPDFYFIYYEYVASPQNEPLLTVRR